MRAREFLVEYRRDITASKLGNMIIAGLAKSSMNDIEAIEDDDLYDATGLVQIANMDADMLKRIENENWAESKWGYKDDRFSVDTAKQTLQKNKQNIINDFLTWMENRDPTVAKEFVPWLTRIWAASQNSNRPLRLEDINRDYLLNAYYLGKKRNKIQPEHRDFNRYNDYYEFEDDILNAYDLNELAQTTEIVSPRGDSKVFHEDDSVRVIVPLDQDAACYYGRGSRWCTAATRGQNYFNFYNRRGPLYILIPKKTTRPGEKYQLQFATDEFKDEQDSDVPLDELIDGFRGFFDRAAEVEPRLANSVYYTSGKTYENIMQSIAKVMLKLIKDDVEPALDLKKLDRDEIEILSRLIKEVGESSGDSIRDQVAYEDREKATITQLHDMNYTFANMMTNELNYDERSKYADTLSFLRHSMMIKRVKPDNQDNKKLIYRIPYSDLGIYIEDIMEF